MRVPEYKMAVWMFVLNRIDALVDKYTVLMSGMSPEKRASLVLLGRASELARKLLPWHIMGLDGDRASQKWAMEEVSLLFTQENLEIMDDFSALAISRLNSVSDRPDHPAITDVTFILHLKHLLDEIFNQWSQKTREMEAASQGAEA